MTKQVVPLHGDDHVLGGPDPFRPSLPFAYGHNDGVTQSVTDDAELLFSTVRTNDGDTFWFDPDDPYGILIVRKGMYRFYARTYGGGSSPREIYAAAQPLSSGPMAGVGNAVGEANNGVFELGPASNPYAVNAVDSVTAVSKSALSYIGTATFPSTTKPSAPTRAAVILVHLGTNYDVSPSGQHSSLYIERIGGLDSDAPPPQT